MLEIVKNKTLIMFSLLTIITFTIFFMSQKEEVSNIDVQPEEIYVIYEPSENFELTLNK